VRWAIVISLMHVLGWASQDADSPSTGCTQDRALRCVRAVNIAVAQYYSQFRRIPTRLDQLGRPKADKATAEGADLITQDLASGITEGWRRSPRLGAFVVRWSLKFGGSRIDTGGSVRVVPRMQEQTRGMRRTPAS
jgi:hypothetical protein